jgi:tripartite-type tricarboxylate transporter receptor subunit TctC
MLERRKFLRMSALGLAGLPLARIDGAFAQSFPTKPVRWVVGYVPAGSTDILARLMGQYLSEKLHQQFVIENKPGAGNNIGTEYVINSPPDGYTVYLVNPANGINASLYKKLNFNFVRDMAPVGGIMRVPNVMIVHPDMPVKTVAEFITYAKANPNKVNLISSGNGTSVHLSGELFMTMTGIKLTHVPYKGSNPALTDMVSGQVHGVMFDNMPSCLQLVKAGKLRALAVSTEKRSDQLPDVPTVGETVKGYEASAWFGMGVPAKTPPDVIAILNKAINEGLADPKVKARLTELGGAPMGGTPADFGRIIASETEKWRKVVELSGASVE